MSYVQTSCSRSYSVNFIRIYLPETSDCCNPQTVGLAKLSISINTCLGPVVQSVVSLTSSLRVILLTVLADSIHNILIFFAEKNVSS